MQILPFLVPFLFSVVVLAHNDATGDLAAKLEERSPRNLNVNALLDEKTCRLKNPSIHSAISRLCNRPWNQPETKKGWVWGFATPQQQYRGVRMGVAIRGECEKGTQVRACSKHFWRMCARGDEEGGARAKFGCNRFLITRWQPSGPTWGRALVSRPGARPRKGSGRRNKGKKNKSKEQLLTAPKLKGPKPIVIRPEKRKGE